MNLKPTEAELKILHILWNNGPSTVKFVNDIQKFNKKVGYTTTLKIMQIMVEKRFLEANKDNRQHVYKVTIDREKTENTLLNSFLENAFNGSASKLVMQLLGNHKTSKNELDEIRKYIDEIEKNENLK